VSLTRDWFEMSTSGHKKLISAIVPAYRTEPYLDTFLELVREQTVLQELEIVLDLNLPSPNELAIVRKHQEILGDCLKVLVNSNLNSISASMNNAIVNSNGKFIAIWNVDDLRTPDSLGLQLEILQSDSSIACAVGPYKKVSKFRDLNGPTVDEPDLSPQAVLSGMHLGPFYMFPKSITEEIGFFDEQLRSGGDFDFAIRLARAGRIESTEALLGWYLDAGLGASTRPNSLQPTERTVIELRYGIFHKLEPSLIPKTYSYSIPNLFFKGQMIPVENYFKDYSTYMEQCLDRMQTQRNKGAKPFYRRILAKLRLYLNYAQER